MNEKEKLKIAVVNGPLMNQLGSRETDIYGIVSLEEIYHRLEELEKRMDIEMCYIQADAEAKLVEFLLKNKNQIDGIVVNPAAFTKAGFTLLETLSFLKKPYIEVHMSNIYARGEWHADSIFAKGAVGQIVGMGADGYQLAVTGLTNYIREGLRVDSKKQTNQIVNLLLHTKGSTTSLLENLVNGKITVNIHCHQNRKREELPLECEPYMRGESFLYRRTSLLYKEEILSDNVVLIPEEGLEQELRANLLKGVYPIGELIDKTECRRNIISAEMIPTSKVQNIFESYDIGNDVEPVKIYTIVKDGKVWFYICELFHHETISKLFYESRK